MFKRNSTKEIPMKTLNKDINVIIVINKLIIKPRKYKNIPFKHLTIQIYINT